jgi:hypothetical protein
LRVDLAEIDAGIRVPDSRIGKMLEPKSNLTSLTLSEDCTESHHIGKLERGRKIPVGRFIYVRE